MRPEAEPWWRQAQADLETARVTLAAGRDYAASWFAQQAAEKGLKALYIERQGALAPRTHDLEYLGREVGTAATVVADLTTLNPAFDLVRYPDPASGRAPVDEVSAALAGQHFAAAERVVVLIDAQLHPDPTPP
jgi:HEPN domain-containing protein